MSPRLTLISIATAVAASIGLSADASAAEHVVKMMNDNGHGVFMTFEPDFVQAAPGDTIKFVPADPGHNAETIPEIWPEGAKPFKGEVSKEVSFTVDKEGIYGVKCKPHFLLGMMALVVVGKPVNADQLKAFQPPEMAAQRYKDLVAKVPQ